MLSIGQTNSSTPKLTPLVEEFWWYLAGRDHSTTVDFVEIIIQITDIILVPTANLG